MVRFTVEHAQLFGWFIDLFFYLGFCLTDKSVSIIKIS